LLKDGTQAFLTVACRRYGIAFKSERSAQHGNNFFVVVNHKNSFSQLAVPSPGPAGNAGSFYSPYYTKPSLRRKKALQAGEPSSGADCVSPYQSGQMNAR
jgi:hypothetical protein